MGKALHGAVVNSAANNSFGTPCGGTTTNTTEGNIQMSFRQAGTFSLLGFNNQTGDGTNTVRFRPGGGDGNQVVARVGAGWQQDVSNTDVISANTLISFGYTDTGTNPSYTPVIVVFQASGDHCCYHVCSSGTVRVFDVASATRFVALDGALVADGTATEAEAQLMCRATGTMRSFQVRVTANARVNQSDWRTRLNGGNGAGLVSYAAGATGLVVDDSNTDTIADGDLINASVTLGTGVEDLTVTLVGAAITASSGATSDLFRWSQFAGLSRSATATAFYFPLVGFGAINLKPTEADTTIRAGFNGTASKLRNYITANTNTDSCTITFRKNAGAGITQTIASGATGWLENSSDTCTFDTDDDICYEIVGGGTGNITHKAAAVSIQDDSAVVTSGLGPLIGGYRNYRTGAGAVLR